MPYLNGTFTLEQFQQIQFHFKIYPGFIFIRQGFGYSHNVSFIFLLVLFSQSLHSCRCTENLHVWKSALCSVCYFSKYGVVHMYIVLKIGHENSSVIFFPLFSFLTPVPYTFTVEPGGRKTCRCGLFRSEPPASEERSWLRAQLSYPVSFISRLSQTETRVSASLPRNQTKEFGYSNKQRGGISEFRVELTADSHSSFYHLRTHYRSRKQKSSSQKNTRALYIHLY
jgi:hypothetical protein